jgi:hypothetical protein
MPLPLPVLDDRRWADLVEEGRMQIPRYAPGWTDHNAHDPGMTLVELFAWLAEMDIYRLNRVPDRHLRKFLGLIGFTPRPPRPASTWLAFRPEPPAAPFTMPAGVVFSAPGEVRQAVPFCTLHDVTVVDARLAVALVDEGSGPGACGSVYREGLPFAPFGADPQPGATLYLGFDRELPAGTPISLAMVCAGMGGVDARARIVAELRARAETYRRPRPGPDCNGAGEKPLELARLVHPSVRTEWEVYPAAGGSAWTALRADAGQVFDDTRAFTLDGIVRLVLPSPTTACTVTGADAPLHYLRCRLVSGQYDAAPRLAGVIINAVAAEQAVPAWQRFPIAPGASCTGKPPAAGASVQLAFTLGDGGVITGLDFAPVSTDGPEVRVLEFVPPGAAPGVLTLELAWLGTGNGAAGQRLGLRGAPELAESVELYTLEPASGGQTWRRWQVRADLDASGRPDPHYTLDARTGEISFGDGEHGRIPGWGAQFLAVYRTTLAERGNAPAGSVKQPDDIPLNRLLLAGLPAQVRDRLEAITSNPQAAVGGAPAETLAEAAGRAAETLWAHERLQALCEQHRSPTLDQIPGPAVLETWPPTRAVNAPDMERLARDVPGTHVRRARAWPNLVPGNPCLKVAGAVTVVVVPELPLKRPLPSRGLLREVTCYLDRRRIVTTRIHVVAPRYLEVSVQAVVQGHAGNDPDRLRTAIIGALDRFLDPLQGGPDGLGWPFGRDVYRAEILQVIDNVPSVDFVARLALSGDGAVAAGGNLCVAPTWLVTPGAHRIQVSCDDPRDPAVRRPCAENRAGT